MKDIVSDVSNLIRETIEAIKPAMGKVGNISQTVIQETSSLGLYCIMTGLVICLIGLLICIIAPIFTKEIEFENDRHNATVTFIVIGTLGFIVGIFVILYNLEKWIAPTRQVIYGIIDKI